MTRHSLLGLTTLTLVLTAGSTLALAQSERPRNPDQPRQPADQTRPADRVVGDRANDRQDAPRLHRASDLIGSTVKNPNGGEEVTHRSPAEILAEIAALDAESAAVLENIRGLLA